MFQRIEAEQTGRFFNETRTEPPLVQREAHFLEPSQLDMKDAFSASWLQRTSAFMEMHLDDIGTCEDAALLAYSQKEGTKKDNFRMTMDWLDFG